MGDGLVRRKQNCFSLDKNGLDQCEGGEKQSQQDLLTEYKREERDVKDNFFLKSFGKKKMNWKNCGSNFRRKGSCLDMLSFRCLLNTNGYMARRKMDMQI